MRFLSSNPKQDRDASAEGEEARRALRDLDVGAMKNFSFEASAAEATKLKEKAEVERILTNRTNRLVGVEPSSREELATSDEASRRFVDSARPISEQYAETEEKSSFRIVIKPDEKDRQGVPSWLLSLLLHVLLILPLGFFGLATSQEEAALDWTPIAVAYEEIERFQDIEIDPLEAMESLDEGFDSGLPTELAEPLLAATGDLSAELVLKDVSGDISMVAAGLDDLGMLLGDGKGLSSLGEGLGTGATASFFGTEVEGKRILYMLDNSGGMKKGKFETLVTELLKSVDSLKPRQQFYVIFYSDTVYPLFYPRSANNFVRATKENKDFLREWLETVELCLGNSIDEAIEAAYVIEPDVVFLLTDGKLFTTDAKEKILLDGAGRSFPINTFGMGVKENSGPAAELKLVAEANRGSYRAILVSPEAKAVAKEKPRTYHNKIPGAVWGKSLGR